MRVAVFSDVHGNLPALERFMAVTRGEVDAYLCLGDVVDYGPWNDECLERVHALPGIVLLEGNHERLFLEKEPIEEEPPLVQDFFRHARQFFTRTDLIAALPVQGTLGTFACRHTLEDRNIYADTAIVIDRDCLIGHSHHAYDVVRSGHRLVNPGSVGQNRRWIDQVDYAVVRVEEQVVELKRVGYDVDCFLKELRSRAYPSACIAYYEGKPRGGVQ